MLKDLETLCSFPLAADSGAVILIDQINYPPNFILGLSFSMAANAASASVGWTTYDGIGQGDPTNTSNKGIILPGLTSLPVTGLTDIDNNPLGTINILQPPSATLKLFDSLGTSLDYLDFTNASIGTSSAIKFLLVKNYECPRWRKLEVYNSDLSHGGQITLYADFILDAPR